MMNTTKKSKEGEESQVQNEIKAMFDSLDSQRKGVVTIQQMLERLNIEGITSDDIRVEEGLGEYLRLKDPEDLNLENFAKLLEGKSTGLIKKAILDKLAIPDFSEFCKDIKKFYNNTKDISQGQAGKEKEKNVYAVSICSIDGQKYQVGDHKEQFALQSVCKPINYAIALHEKGELEVHKHVGREPSGRGYNGLVLNQENLPHNSLINAGAIMTCSLIKPELSVDKRHRYVKDIWSRLCGNTSVGFDEEVSKAEGKGTQRNMALSYYMLEKEAFPEDVDIYKTMELYNKCCGIEIDIDQLAMAAATLANGGFCPTTGDKVFDSDDVRDCLSLMLSCGMYDYSGEFAFLVGLPAKSGVSGAMMVVVPGLMGMAIYSPPLDKMGNPVRGVEFCKELVNEYSLHKYDFIVDSSHQKKDPGKTRIQSQSEAVIHICWAASQGDLREIQNLMAQGVSAETANFDKRTPLHLAAAEGHLKVVKYLLDSGVDPYPKDRWDHTPLSDAVYGKHTKVAALLKRRGGK